MTAIIIFSILLLAIVCKCSSHSQVVFPCKTPNIEDGLCISLFSCRVLMKSLETLEQSAIKFVKQSICENNIPNTLVVCCGKSGNFFYHDVENTVTTEEVSVVFANVSHTTANYVTANVQLPSSIINIDQKEPTVNITTQQSSNLTFTINENNNATTDTQNFSTELSLPKASPTVEQASLTTASQINVTTETISTQVNSSVEEHRNHVKLNLLPSRTYCGLQHTDDRIYTDNITALDEFPWLTHVIFLEDNDDEPDQYLDRCNGVLINSRYVLTSEYCATYAPAVRLGQHYTNETISCTEDATFDDCTEPRIDVNVEEETHRINVTNAWHNFALLRLAKKIRYSDYIRPICLNFDYPDIPITRNSLLFSGWGATGGNNMIKKRLTYNVTQNVDECLKWDDKDLKNASARGEAVCLVPRESGGELACTGDEGGPLTYSHRHQWFAEGLITKVYDKITDQYCSNELPISGVKITTDVLNWILDNIHD